MIIQSNLSGTESVLSLSVVLNRLKISRLTAANMMRGLAQVEIKQWENKIESESNFIFIWGGGILNLGTLVFYGI